MSRGSQQAIPETGAKLPQCNSASVTAWRPCDDAGEQEKSERVWAGELSS